MLIYLEAQFSYGREGGKPGRRNLLIMTLPDFPASSKGVLWTGKFIELDNKNDNYGVLFAYQPEIKNLILLQKL